MTPAQIGTVRQPDGIRLDADRRCRLLPGHPRGEGMPSSDLSPVWRPVRSETSTDKKINGSGGPLLEYPTSSGRLIFRRLRGGSPWIRWSGTTLSSAGIFGA